MAETTTSLSSVLKEDYDDSTDRQKTPSRVIKRMMGGKGRGKARGSKGIVQQIGRLR